MALRHAALVSVRAGDPSPFPLQFGEVFLSPLGLAAAAVAIPIVLLYLVRPDPEDLRLPTFRFLAEEAGQQRTNPFFSRFRRSLLLLLQVLVVLAIAVSLASPYVTVAERQTVSETVLVVDASASMATRTDGGTTRFARAVSTARDEVTSRTTVVVATGGGRVLLRGGSPTEAEQALGDLRPTDAPGDLRGAIATASAVAGEEARIVVLSDFADDSDWATAVRTARARGLPVRLEQFGGGGEGNVGIVDRTFSGTEVEFAVRNFGDARATRTLQFAGARRQLTLQPGDVATATFAVPAGGGTAQLAPGDAFPVDDAVAVAAPADATIDVLLLTNDRNRYLATAMEVIEPVSLTVDSPPTTVDEQYDVIVYSNLDPDSLLRGNVDAGRETLERGGGVVVAAQRSPPDRLSDLLLVAPQSVKSSPSIESTADDPLTRGIAFSPPEEYLAGPLREGRPLVRLSDGSPLIATAQRGPGRLLYYGYLESASSFRFNYQYPVFWKRAVFYLSGREPLPALNYRTGDGWTLGAEATVSTPRGQVTAATVPLDGAGFYAAGDRRVAAALLDESESDVAAPPLEERSGPDAVPVTEETRQVPRDVSHWVALAAIVAVLGEVGFLRYRGDL
jgi:hypothetical protein